MSSRREEKERLKAERLSAQAATDQATERRRRLMILAGAIALAVAIVAIVIVAGAGDDGTGEEPASGLLRGVEQEGISLGNADAPVTIVEFADLQCPFCAEFSNDVFPQLVDRYVRPGEVRLELRVLSFIGPDSIRAAEVAAAAAEQDRLWGFAEAFFSNQRTENTGYVDEEFLREVMDDVPGLDADQALEEAATEPSVELLAEADELAAEEGIDSTPSFLIGQTGEGLRRLEVNALEIEVFSDAIEAELGRPSG